MSFTLRVRMRRVEGALVRLVWLVGRRGYELLEILAKPTSEGASWDVLLKAQSLYPEGQPGYRKADTLARMVERLYDVENVELQEGAEGK